MGKVSGLKLTILVDDYAGYDVRYILAQHGLSILLELEYDAGRNVVLFDVGQDFNTIKHNAGLLGADLPGVSTIVLSHRHYDHTGGLRNTLEYFKEKRINIVCHPDLWKPQFYIAEKRIALDIGVPVSRSALQKYNINLIESRSPLPICQGAMFLGEIPRTTGFEEQPRNFYTLDEKGEIIRDLLLDDTGIAVDVEGLGLIIIAGCSHSGIVNITRRAVEVFNENPYAIVGGLHLVSADDKRIISTISELKNLGVQEVYIGHCTGLRAESMFYEHYGNRFHKIRSGYRVHFKP